jgi:hypothetical protein
VEEADRAERGLQVASTSAMIAEDTPVLESGDRVLDPCSATPVPSPPMIADDAIALKSRCNKLRDPSVSAVGEHPSVALTPRLYGGRSMVARCRVIPDVVVTRSRRRQPVDEHERVALGVECDASVRAR